MSIRDYPFLTWAAPVLLAACADPICTMELGIRYVPGDTTIAVGQSFTASVALSSCGGREHPSDVFTWRAQDTTVVTVDSKTGRVTGRAPGETWVEATGQTYGFVGGPHVVVH